MNHNTSFSWLNIYNLSIEISDLFVSIIQMLLIFSIPITFEYIAKKKIGLLKLSEQQKEVIPTLLIYCTLINFPFVVFFISFLIDCIFILISGKNYSAIYILMAIILYLLLLYKILIMLILFKKNALLINKIFISTLPFVFTLCAYSIAKINNTLTKYNKILEYSNEYIVLFVPICFFSIPYLLFFSFSKRIKAAWVDTNTSSHDARADP